MQLEGNVIVCDTIDEKGLGILKNAGLHVEYLPEITNQDLISRAKDYDVIIVRSRTKITKDVIVRDRKSVV